jgi:tRNA-splicing ligase RtcB (3'-phosphate/5'-hydroxy nucleic acid ligase)
VEEAVMILALVIFEFVGIDKIIILLGNDATGVKRKRRELKERRRGQEQRVALVAIDIFPELKPKVFREIAMAVHFSTARAKDAAEYCEKRNLALPDRDLAYLPMDTKEAKEYKSAMDFALLFARANRFAIREHCKEILEKIAQCRFMNEIDIHHNYAAQETHFGRNVIVHRKGATSARRGETGIIPGSMGTASYIVEGLGNPESFESCSHGAGRTMGRNEANRRLSLEDARASMKGVVFDGWKSGKNKKLDLSEAPQAYKDIEAVMKAQKDLVEIKVKLLPLGVVKG